LDLYLDTADTEEDTQKQKENQFVLLPEAELQGSRLFTGKRKINHLTLTRGCTWLSRCFLPFSRGFPDDHIFALSAKGNDVRKRSVKGKIGPERHSLAGHE
jgi:hypothetical protein